MNVVMLSNRDYAGSGWQFCQAVQSKGVNIRLVTASENQYKYKKDYILEHCSNVFLQDIINQADIIHFKGDDLPTRDWHGLRLPDVPIIITCGGSGFRRHTDDKLSKKWGSFEDYKNITDFRSVLTADLNYPEFDGVYLPQVYEDLECTFEEVEVPLIVHSPTDREKKGTDKYIMPALELLRERKVDFKYKVIEGVSNKECLAIKSKASLFIDQVCGTGFYGMSSIEAMAMCIPVVNYISDEAIKQANGKLDDCPIINVKCDVVDIADKIESALKNLKELSDKTRKYFKKVHSYKACELPKIYEELYESNKERILEAKKNIVKIEKKIEHKDKVLCKILSKKVGVIGSQIYLDTNTAKSLMINNYIQVI